MAGHRILRGEAPGGPYELVGKAARAAFTDVMLERNRRCYCIVQAYDDSGVRSVHSAEATGMSPALHTYLPVVLKQ